MIVGYHNEETMGERLNLMEFDLHTSTDVKQFIGEEMVVIKGRGKSPKQFFLCQRFVVAEVARSQFDGFDYCVIGRDGMALRFH